MFFFAHLLAGLIIGYLSGNYLIALVGALVLDLDHLWIYFKHKILFKPKKFWKTITSPKDPYGNQRNYLHSFLFWIIISILILLINWNIGVIFSLAYLSHLLLDLLDGSDFYPLYPIKWKVKGPIKYLSWKELVFTLILLIIFIFFFSS